MPVKGAFETGRTGIELLRLLHRADGSRGVMATCSKGTRFILLRRGVDPLFARGSSLEELYYEDTLVTWWRQHLNLLGLLA